MIFTPSPVMPSTPMMIEAQRMIAAMVPICLPPLMQASSSRSSSRSYSAPTPDSRASEEEWVLRLLNPFSPDQQFD